MAKRAVLLVWLVGLVGCGEGSSSLGPGAPVVTGDGGAAFEVGGSGEAGVGTGEVALAILAPAAQAVLPVTSAPEIRVRVESLAMGAAGPAADPIDPGSVRYVLGTGDPDGASVTGSLVGPTFDFEYTARADLTPLPTGPYLLTITAATRSGAVGVASVPVLVDAGPRITILAPRAQGAYKGSAAVEVMIDPLPFELGAPPEAFVGTVAVPLEPGPGLGRYRGALEFNKFDPPLIDDQLFRVVARNQQGTVAEEGVVFFVDDDGPLFETTQPAEGQVVGGVVRIAATLSDRAGVLGPSVVAFIGNRGGEGFELELRPEGRTGVFSALFDTRKLSACLRGAPAGLCNLWPNLSFRASDLLGNERVVAYDIGIDNQPPRIDLDPPDMRIKRFGDGWECSWLFDPLGFAVRLGDPPNDGCGVGQVFDLRARIEDEGNWAAGVKLPPTSLVDPPTVTAFVLDDTAQALAVDIDGDNICDGINPTLIPTTMPPTQSNEILAVRLRPVMPTGAGNFTPDPSIPMDPALTGVCGPGSEPQPPDPLCFEQALTVAIGYPAASSPEPAIWTIEPIDDSRCVGSQFDAHANRIQEGWACIAVVATDRVGNASVSHPLRVYIDYRASTLGPGSLIPHCPAPPASAGPPPDCTGRYDRATNALVAGRCAGARFGPGEVRPR